MRDGARHAMDASRLAVCGDSSVGKLSAVLALMAKERGDVRVDITAVRVLGMVHDFLMLDSLRDANATKAARHLAVDAPQARVGQLTCPLAPV